MRIAIDFDDTLAKYDPACPGEIGKPILRNIQLAVRLQRKGHKLILWTCREGESLTRAVQWCEDTGLHFDAVNENIRTDPETMRWPNSRKVYADLYIDDKAISAQSAEIICGLL